MARKTFPTTSAEIRDSSLIFIVKMEPLLSGKVSPINQIATRMA